MRCNCCISFLGADTVSEESEDRHHIYPANDLKEHNIDDENCWCRPKIEGVLVIHNSLDRRELYEGTIH